MPWVTVSAWLTAKVGTRCQCRSELLALSEPVAAIAELERARADGGRASVGVGLVEHQRAGAELGQADHAAKGTGGIGDGTAGVKVPPCIGGIEREGGPSLQTLRSGVGHRDVAQQGVQIGGGESGPRRRRRR